MIQSRLFVPAVALVIAAASALGTATPAHAQPVFGLAPRVGLDVPTSPLGLFVVGGLGLDFFLPALDHRLVLGLDASYTAPSFDGDGADPRVNGDYTYTITEQELKLGLDLAFRFFTDDRPVIPYLGVGFIVQFLETAETTSFGPRAEHLEQSTEPGFEVFGGVDFRLGPGFLLAELRFVHTGLDHRLTGNSNAGNLALAVGYRFVF